MNQTSFKNEHSPTRFELREFLMNCSSFNAKGLPKPKVILDQSGRPVPAIEFMLLNTTLCKKERIFPNPNETIFIQNKTQGWKTHSLTEREKLKEIKQGMKKEFIEQGKIWKNWERIIWYKID